MGSHYPPYQDCTRNLQCDILQYNWHPFIQSRSRFHGWTTLLDHIFFAIVDSIKSLLYPRYTIHQHLYPSPLATINIHPKSHVLIIVSLTEHWEYIYPPWDHNWNSSKYFAATQISSSQKCLHHPSFQMKPTGHTCCICDRVSHTRYHTLLLPKKTMQNHTGPSLSSSTPKIAFKPSHSSRSHIRGSEV